MEGEEGDQLAGPWRGGAPIRGKDACGDTRLRKKVIVE
jgi:hypothetical protein